LELRGEGEWAICEGGKGRILRRTVTLAKKHLIVAGNPIKKIREKGEMAEEAAPAVEDKQG